MDPVTITLLSLTAFILLIIALKSDNLIPPISIWFNRAKLREHYTAWHRNHKRYIARRKREQIQWTEDKFEEMADHWASGHSGNSDE